MSKSNNSQSTIMFTDIVGYSAMINKDETHALNLLVTHDKIIEPIIANYKGKIIKKIGDAIFAEFDNSDGAAKAAIEIQKELKSRNKNAKGTDQISVRIGLHYGNVVVKGGDLFGNDVNLCARIEPTAVPGGIASSNAFLSQVSDENIFTTQKSW